MKFTARWAWVLLVTASVAYAEAVAPHTLSPRKSVGPAVGAQAIHPSPGKNSNVSGKPNPGPTVNGTRKQGTR